MDPCALVRQTCEWVAGQCTEVSIDPAAVEAVVQGLHADTLDQLCHVGRPGFDTELHFVDPQRPSLTILYLLMVDAINFCFWPDGALEYEHLAGGLKGAVLSNPSTFTAEWLACITATDLQQLLAWPRPLPLAEERAGLLREVGAGLVRRFDGSASKLVEEAEGSVVKLVQLVLQTFPGFRDQASYRGRTVYFYKRAQILCGDVYGAFGGQGPGRFHDIQSLTMFADYRVPVVLRELGVLVYSTELQEIIDQRQEIQAGTEREVELRAATVVAVERIREAVGRQVGGRLPLCIFVDWWLWGMGEAQRHQHRPHHRTLTTFY